MARVSVRGIPEMRAKLNDFVLSFPDRVAEALYLEGLIEMTESKRRVPVDTGVLRASGRVEEPQRYRGRISVTLSYGGAAENYAIIVHEDLDAHHSVGQAKYLESVLNESRSSMAARLAKRLRF